MTGIIRRPFIDRRGHHPDKRLKQLPDFFDVTHILNRNRRLRRHRFHHQRHILRKGTDIFHIIQRIDQLQHSDPLSFPVAHGHHQHGAGVITGHGIIAGRTGEIILLIILHIFNTDRPVLQKRHGADVVPAQRNRRKFRPFSPSPGICLQCIVAHDLKLQRVTLPQIQRPRITVRQLHHTAKNAFQQTVQIPFCRQQHAYFQNLLHLFLSHTHITIPSFANRHAVSACTAIFSCSCKKRSAYSQE